MEFRRGESSARSVRSRRRDPAEAINPELSCAVSRRVRGRRAHPVGAVIDPVSLDSSFSTGATMPMSAEYRGQRTTDFFWMTKGGEITLPNFIMPPLCTTLHCLIGLAGMVCRCLRPRPRRAVSRFILALPRPKLFTARAAKSGQSRTRRLVIARDFFAQYFLHAWHGAARQIHSVRAGGRRLAAFPSKLIAKFGARQEFRAAEVRHRPEEVLGDRPDKHNQGMIQHSFGCASRLGRPRWIVPLSL